MSSLDTYIRSNTLPSAEQVRMLEVDKLMKESTLFEENQCTGGGGVQTT
jgi:predicted outer membrane repeat protein